MNSRSLITLAFAGAFTFSIASAGLGQDQEPQQDAPSAYAYADALMQQGEPELACVLISEVYGLETREVGALSRLAGCMLVLGDPEESKRFIDRALEVDPDNETLKAQAETIELALELIELEKAAKQFEATQAEVAALRAAAQQPRPAPRPIALAPVVAPVVVEPVLPDPLASGRISVSGVYDSNINGGTYHDTVTAMGLPMMVDSNSKEVGGWGIRLSADGSVIIPVDWENGLELTGGIHSTIYGRHSGHDKLSVSSDLSWIVGTNITGGRVRGHGNLEWIGGLFDQFSIGLDVSGHHQIAQGTTLHGGIDVTHRNNANSFDTGWAVRGNAGIRHLIANGISVGASIAAERVAVQSPIRSHWKIGPELSVSATITERLGLTLAGGVDFVNFDSGLAMFVGDRVDTRYRVGARLSYALPEIAQGMTLNASYDFTHQQSNHDIYDNNKHVIAVGLSYNF